MGTFKSYVKAKDVTSPLQLWKTVRVLIDPGPGGVSWALGLWENDPVLASRWNGHDEGEQARNGTIGHPQSRGLAVWFIHPSDTYPFLLPYIEKIAPNDAQFVRGFLDRVLAKHAA
jgi:hypothetical protein